MLSINSEYQNVKLAQQIDEIKKQLEDFFGIIWNMNPPRIILVPTRKVIDEILDRKTESWEFGWANGNMIFMLSPENFENECSHKYSNEMYYKAIKHEMTHAFTSIISNGSFKPIWLFEGIAVFLSDQNSNIEKKLDFSIIEDFDVFPCKYTESGFIVESLYDKSGKEKMIELIAESGSVQSYSDFQQVFKRIYGIELNRDSIKEFLA